MKFDQIFMYNCWYIYHYQTQFTGDVLRLINLPPLKQIHVDCGWL